MPQALVLSHLSRVRCIGHFQNECGLTISEKMHRVWNEMSYFDEERELTNVGRQSESDEDEGKMGVEIKRRNI